MRPNRRSDDRGSAELAVATPLLLLLVLLVVQVAIWMHGDHVATSVAQRAIDAARTAEEGDAQSYAESVADDLGGSMLSERSIVIERGATTARVAVSAEVPTIIPGFSWPVRHELTAPVERFVPPTPAEVAP
ncbi:TadE/TadG family type IV pilus assembly protein [Marinactinospora rubrisoli]|uniref:TadE/TadG family type IV pilus assembly protein n=1 Tax=Marinactinospora rubrisoli TaxID=2715399 RepID=A0ABW2KC66_9ACTN